MLHTRAQTVHIHTYIHICRYSYSIYYTFCTGTDSDPCLPHYLSYLDISALHPSARLFDTGYPGSACICCCSVAVLIACGNYECRGERLQRGVEKRVVACTLFHPSQILITGLYVSTHTTKETNDACQYSPCVHTHLL